MRGHRRVPVRPQGVRGRGLAAGMEHGYARDASSELAVLPSLVVHDPWQRGYIARLTYRVSANTSPARGITVPAQKTNIQRIRLARLSAIST